MVTFLQDVLTTRLEDYAAEPGKTPMDLVLFRYMACKRSMHSKA